MGIRTNCPQCGHKLNLKAHLAGKIGVCPQCQAKFRIPELPAGSSPDGSDIELPPSIQPVQQQAPAAAPATPAKPAGAQAAQAPTQATVQSVTSPQQAQASATAAAPNTAVPAATSVQGTPQVTPAQAAPAQASATPVQAVAPAGVVAQQVTPVAAQQAPDVFSEAPEAVWYVRPPSGGQYGPAKSDVMRGWLQEGRVTADSLVWREGWADWKRADATFPNLGKGAAPAAAAPQAAAAAASVPQAGAAAVPAGVAQGAVPQAAATPVGGQAGIPVGGAVSVGSADPFGAPSIGTASTRSVTYRRRNKAGRVVGITVLIVATLILLPLLYYVLSNQ